MAAAQSSSARSGTAARSAARFDHPPPPMTLQTLLQRGPLPRAAAARRLCLGLLRGRGRRARRRPPPSFVPHAVDWSQQRARCRASSVPTALQPPPRRHHVAVALPSPAAMPLAAASAARSPRARHGARDAASARPFWKQPKADGERDGVAPSRQLPAPSSRTGYARRRRRARRRARPGRPRPAATARATPLVGTDSGWAVAAGSARAAAAAAAAAAATPAAAPPAPPAEHPSSCARPLSAPAGPGAAPRRAAVRSRCGSPSTPRPARASIERTVSRGR